MEKINYTVDVIVPVYNVELYVAECLDSLLNQTLPVRIIIVEDGSTDSSRQIVRAYSEKHPENILLIEQKNQGLSGARNTGIQHVTADYCAFMDSDDWVSDDYYESLYQAIKAVDASIACSDITYAYQKHTELKQSNTLNTDIQAQGFIVQSDLDFHKYIIDIFPMIQNKLWKTDLIRKNNMEFLHGRLYEDLDFFYRIFPYTPKIAFTSNGVFYYRQRKGSIVKVANPRVFEITDIFTNILNEYKEQGIFPEYQEEIEYLLIRNTLVASSRRLSYSQSFSFIDEHLKQLYRFVETTVPKWRKNSYIKPITIRHLYLKSIHPWTIWLHSFSLVIIGSFIGKKDEF